MDKILSQTQVKYYYRPRNCIENFNESAFGNDENMVQDWNKVKYKFIEEITSPNKEIMSPNEDYTK